MDDEVREVEVEKSARVDVADKAPRLEVRYD